MAIRVKRPDTEEKTIWGTSVWKKIDLPDKKSSLAFCSRIPKEILLTPGMYKELWELRPATLGKVMMFGKEVETPRFTLSFGKAYTFSGKTCVVTEISHPYLGRLLSWVCEHSGRPMNQILVNWYKDGTHGIGPHSDDEKQLVPGAPIYSFSFGQTRKFVVSAKDKSYRETFLMPDNSLVIMHGDMQKLYKHEVPKDSSTASRINITFRQFVE